ncbi:histidine phosphatase superfamily protein [Tanacetum coccineum]
MDSETMKSKLSAKHQLAVKGLSECKASKSNIGCIQVRYIVKEVKDHLKTYSSAGMDISWLATDIMDVLVSSMIWVVDPAHGGCRKRGAVGYEASSSQTKTTKEAALILIRHGESLWNEKNLFTGCVDVPLTKKGVEVAVEAGKRISNMPIDVIYTSALIRAQMTTMLAMTQHRRKKMPIVLHNESEQAQSWSQIFSQDTEKQCIPVVTAWQLNERMYWELQGLNKQETADKYGKEQVHGGVVVELTISGKECNDRGTREFLEVISLELSTGIPMLYIVKDENYIRRGSPAAPSEASVYAYTKNLARYRQKLDEMVH